MPLFARGCNFRVQLRANHIMLISLFTHDPDILTGDLKENIVFPVKYFVYVPFLGYMLYNIIHTTQTSYPRGVLNVTTILWIDYSI